MKNYRVPEAARALLKKPMGLLIPTADVSKEVVETFLQGCRNIITVGDKTTETLVSMGIIPDVQVMDGLEMRKSRTLPVAPYVTEIQLKNPAGTISDEAIRGVEASKSKPRPVRIIVEGEEDLLALLFAASYRVGSAVLYGQPGEGLVVVKVDKGSKKRARSILAEIGVEGL